MSDLDELVGKRVLSVLIAEDGGHIQFDTDAGPLLYEAVGDCCSSSWVQDVIGVTNLLGALVVSRDLLDLPDATPEGHYGAVAAYGVRLNTAFGACEVIYRNESNGYYGGWLQLRPAGVEGLRPLTADFDAGNKISTD